MQVFSKIAFGGEAKNFSSAPAAQLGAHRKDMIANALQGGTWVIENMVFKEGDEIIQEGDQSKDGFRAKEAVKAKSICPEMLF